MSRLKCFEQIVQNKRTSEAFIVSSSTNKDEELKLGLTGTYIFTCFSGAMLNGGASFKYSSGGGWGSILYFGVALDLKVQLF